MTPFKVICKADGRYWAKDLGMKTTITKKFFGLIKRTSIVKDLRPVHGPSKDEICIVSDVKEDGFYKLSGYAKFGWYDPDYFIRLDEFTDTQKEIAEKSQPALN